MSWFESFFDERYLRFYPALRRQPVARDEAAFVMEALGLSRGESVLDLGCGTGRHSVALAAKGLSVTGLDLSPDLLAQARTTAEEEGVSVRWLERDMRELDDLGPLDACVSLYTAFGFLGDAEDQEVLRQVTAALRPQGKLLLDLTNYLGYLRRFPSEVWHETSEGVTRERNRYDAVTGVLITERAAFLHAGGKLELPESHVRAYLPHEVLSMLRQAGLTVDRVLGALEPEAAFSWADSPNQIYICRRS